MRNIIILSLAMVLLGAGVCGADSLNVSLIGRCNIDGFIYSVFISDSYAYMADQYYGFHIIDISDPAHPYEIGSWGSASVSGRRIFVSGSIVYLADRNGGLRIINASEPSDPFQISSFGSSARAIEVSDSIAYLTTGEYSFHTIDVSDSAHPEELGFIEGVGLSDVLISNSYAYISDMYYGLQIIDISDPTSPFIVGGYSEGIGETVGANCVAIHDSYAYMPWEYGTIGIIIIDISNPEHPSLSGFYHPGFYFTKDIVIVDTFAYTVNGYGLSILDISYPTHPYEVGYYDTEDVALGLFIQPPYAYVADRYDGLYILDVSHFTGIKEEAQNKPRTLSLTAFPNPFNSSCAITANVGAGLAPAQIEIYDLRGEVVGATPRGRPDDVSEITEGHARGHAPTNRTFIWTPDETIASGIYLVRARTEDGGTAMRKVVLVR